MAEGAMTAFLTEIGTFFTQAIAWGGDILEMISGNPILLVMSVAMPVSGFAIGLVKRLFRLP